MKRSAAFALGLFLLLVGAWQTSTAQEQAMLRITSVDKSGFPLVRVNLITADSRGAPLTDLSALSLRENGIPIGDLAFDRVPVSSNIIFVIDANSSFTEVDDAGGLSRQEKVQQSIIRYSQQFMSDGDKVTIVIPSDDMASGRFLVEDETTREGVSSALNQYNPETLARTPLQEMMLLALAHAADGKDNGHYQAILLFTDGAQLHQQLTYSTLVEQAQDAEVPLFAALLGARADPNEVDNVVGLTGSTHATYVHMPEPADTDAIYSIWRRQGEQTQISYRSLQSKSGRYPITVNLGAARALTELVLEIAPPMISFGSTEATIVRTGGASDTPLMELEPGILAVRAVVRWTDELPRPLVSASLFVDGRPSALPTSLQPDASGQLLFEWNIANLDEGTYSLVVQLTDELGISAVSEPLPISVAIERPPPPTPTIPPTSTPENEAAVPQIQIQAEDSRLLVILVGIAGMAALLLVLLRWRRRRSETKAEPDHDTPEIEATESLPDAVESVPHIAYLEMLGAEGGQVAQIRIEGERVTIGRDHRVAQIVFDDDSVAQLHAQIRKRDGRYWLYDEGSANGTFHNYERLGLTPRLLEDQDTIHFGSIGLRFHMVQQIEEAVNDDE